MKNTPSNINLLGNIKTLIKSDYTINQQHFASNLITLAFTLISIVEPLYKNEEILAFEKINSLKEAERIKLIKAINNLDLFYATLSYVKGNMNSKEFKQLFK